MIKEKKIAVFQAFINVQSQLGYMVKTLSEEGFEVDLFVHECNTEYFKIIEDERIRVHQIDRPCAEISQKRTRVGVNHITSWFKKSKMPPIAIRLMDLLKLLLRKHIPEFMLPRGEKLIPRMLLEAALSKIRDGNYACLIGVEKAGLIWAGLIGESTGLPWIYYSLELYTSDHDYYYEGNFVRYRRAEKRYHQKAIATIIQDQDRADVLFKDNGIKGGKAIFVPVSIMGEVIKKKSDYLREEHHIPKDKVVVLQFGLIFERRLCKEVMIEAHKFDDDICLIMHGDIPDNKEIYRHLTLSGKIILSEKLIPSSEIGDLISSSDIGLVFYRKNPINDYLVASSSEKLALYLQSGIPVVMFDYPSFAQINDKYQFGVCIGKLEELEQAISKIRNNYSYYRENAFAAFTDHYEYRRNFLRVVDIITSLPVITQNL